MASPPWQVAAQQTWDAMPFWQKALVSYGKGASDVVRGDIGYPARLLGEKLGLAHKGAAERYAQQTRDMGRGFEGLKGLGPHLGADIGSTATLLPAAMATDGAVEGMLPAARAGGGLLAALRRMAPVSAGGAALGGLEPEERRASAVLGGLLPILGGIGGRAVGDAFSVLHPDSLYHALVSMPDVAAVARAAVKRVPGAVRETVGTPASVLTEVAKKRAKRPVKTVVNRLAFEQGGAGEQPGSQR